MAKLTIDQHYPRVTKVVSFCLTIKSLLMVLESQLPLGNCQQNILSLPKLNDQTST